MKYFLILFFLSCFFLVSRAILTPKSSIIPTQNDKAGIINKVTRNNDECHILASIEPSSITATAIGAVAKLIASCGIGVYTSKIGLLDKSALTMLSKLVYDLFQPCLLFTNVCTTVASTSNKGAMGLLLLAGSFQVAMGYLIGKIFSYIFYGSKVSEESKQLLACTTLSNSAPLPLTFIDGILKSNMDKTLCPRAIGYLSIYMVGWAPLFWILGPSILSVDKEGPVDKKAERALLMRRIFSPPVMSSLVGAFVGSFPLLSNQLLRNNGLLRSLFQAMESMGQAYIPICLLILAGSLMSTDDTKSPATSSAGTERNGFIKQVLAVYFAKFFVAPVVGFATLAALKERVPFLASAMTDPILVFVLLLEACMPSAQNLAVILQLQGNRAGAARIARLLLALYVLGVPAISFWLMKILQATAINL